MTLLDGTVPDYWQSAACNTGDASLLDTFYPPHGGSYGKARAICRTCPVSAECLERSLDEETNGRRHGMRGGLTPPERDDLARSAVA